MTPAIDHAYPLRQTAEAVGHLIDGRTRGKVVITVPDRHRA
jgi:NADPH:quinone reductase-like Zn-dependent oxidoreductase